MEELKPCPFCASKDIKIFSIPLKNKDAVNNSYTVVCSNCFASSGQIINDKHLAIKKWNMRTG